MSDNTPVYNAAGLSQSAGRVWELRLAARPCFVQDLLRLPLNDGVHILGAEAQTLRGKSVEWVLEVLVPLLDGTRTISDLLSLLPDLSEVALRDVLHLIQMHGMLEDGDDNSTPEWRDGIEKRFGSQMRFFSRYLHITGRCRNRYEAQRALLHARLALIGEPLLITILAEQLATLGIGETLCGASRPEGDSQDSVIWGVSDPAKWSPLDLVVCVGNVAFQQATARQCFSSGWPLLSIDPSTLTLGPLTYPHISACPGCVHRQIMSNSDSVFDGPSGVRRMWEYALVSRAAQQVVAYVTGLFQPTTLSQVESFHPALGQTKQHHVVRLPNCPICGDVITPLTTVLPTGHLDNLALLYHFAAAIQPWHIQQPASMAQHLAPGVQHLTHSAYMQYDWAQRLGLPDSAAGLGDPSGAALMGKVNAVQDVSLDLMRLGKLLRYSAGGQSTPLDEGGYYLQRHTASGGNLGSAEVYVMALDVVGLVPGLYHYLIVDHTLEVLRLGFFADNLTGCLPNGTTEAAADFMNDAAAVLIIVSAVSRECAKYSDRGYMYCLLDAGLLAHRFAFLCRQMGQCSRLAWEFNDESLTDLLEIDGFQLAPAMLVALVRHPSRV